MCYNTDFLENKLADSLNVVLVHTKKLSWVIVIKPRKTFLKLPHFHVNKAIFRTLRLLRLHLSKSKIGLIVPKI